ncbi:MAG: hypothetical protein JNG86_13245 [Verrucomicrobiaceae bacterium]|nr:hypothetical protein [Verrucomicrobiaceae bacterium]
MSVVRGGTHRRAQRGSSCQNVAWCARSCGPSRIASLALGTSDLDCVYHIALAELLEAVKQQTGGAESDQFVDLNTLVDGKRLRDITAKWTKPPTSWVPATNQFAIQFGARFFDPQLAADQKTQPQSKP